MPSQPTASQVRLNNITTCLMMTINALQLLATNFDTPFLQAILNTTQSLLDHIQAVKQNKDSCVQLMEQTYTLINAIIVVHGSATSGVLPPTILENIGKFTEHTLHKIHTFVEAQRNWQQNQKIPPSGRVEHVVQGLPVWFETRTGFLSDKPSLFRIPTDIEHLALMITMRGAQRPGKMQWTRPFLQPLKPLDQDAARKTFIDIADENHNLDEVDKVLSLTDNMPLAVSLIAHLVDSEGCPNVLARWEREKISVISVGTDKEANLEISISLSLSSPRLNRHSRDLLSLLSMLPDGLSDVELVQSKLPIRNVLGCKAALIGTALAYSNEQKRLKALVPIREYMNKIQPPSENLIRPLFKHFQFLLKFFQDHRGSEKCQQQFHRYHQSSQHTEYPSQWTPTGSS
ncbi:hypothetical protein B0H14DRAFT_3637647 [Mycena olivaceomarginata]|nr:hypothetical protein B0H14DRAFT_3637647 [Mycena olivaceomarginata]